MPKKDEKTEDRCPHCGYCPHCGQSARPVAPMPYPVPVPYRPWGRPYYSEIPMREHSISTSYSLGTVAPENRC